MGFWSRLLGWDRIPFDTYDAAQRVLPEPYEPFLGLSGIPVADPGYPLAAHGKTQVEGLWRSQPNIRKVVDFIARNVASIPFHAHERISDTDRQRLTDHPLAEVLRQPQPRVGAFRFWHSILSDSLLYDRWAAIKQPRPDGRGIELVQVPSWRLRFDVDALKRVTAAWYWVGDEDALRRDDEDGWRQLDLDMLVFDHGYAPRTAGLSPLETLRDVLEESMEAVRYRRQVWQNGGRFDTWIERPPVAPGHDWSDAARERFKTSFRAAYTGDGSNAGGVPLLEDGMKLHSLSGFTPQDAMDLEGRRLSAIEVASAYHIAPELVGAQQGNYSNVREYRQMLYRDSLGPYIKAIEDVLNAQLVPDFTGGPVLYVEANVEAKLRGSFEEQAQMMSSAIGAPWLTRNEGRALMNRPEMDGGDDLVVPLNVLIGGQASPRDAGSQNLRSGTSGVKAVKEQAPTTHVERTRGVLADFFKRQERAVLSALGAKADGDWWDGERWDRELARDLYRLAVMVSKQVASETLKGIGFSPDEYDADRTLAFLVAVADRIAGAVNSATRKQIEAALAEAEGDPVEAVAHVFEVAETSRAETSAMTAVTTFAGFASTEAARQVSGERATKTWLVNSGNPRSSHAAMNGETVGIDERFSNGAKWPGDAMLDVDELAGCQCSIVIDIPTGG